MACQLGLTGGLLLNNRRDEVADGFELMPVCPGQEKRDIIAQTSRERVVRCHPQRLSQGLSSCLLVTSENVSRHQVLRERHGTRPTRLCQHHFYGVISPRRLHWDMRSNAAIVHVGRRAMPPYCPAGDGLWFQEPCRK